ncbi:kinase-like domain-containing protein [Crepidotus variabilis]|uniref:mitogen-activated protein kinase kinase n=1 Tax=Crepidotus variabilis TaxID=179855 RepID=A0A9P6JQY6_9AGAR|nr:kinase-like domain-containing protein [Crepidotus variabilis]
MSESKQPRTMGSSLTGLRQHQPLATPIPPLLQQRMAAFANRGAAPRAAPSAADFRQNTNAHNQAMDDAADKLRKTELSIGHGNSHPTLQTAQSFPRPKQKAPMGLAAKRMRPGMNLAAIDPKLVVDDSVAAMAAGLAPGRPAGFNDSMKKSGFGTPFSNFSKIVDPSGALHFDGKAILHSSGVNFSNGKSFSISMDHLSLDEELGRGNYGTVKKVVHRPTKVAMAMKEIRLELEDAKLRAIIMELDVLHRAVAPEIIEFYGAFFIESCVYYCMEYMDAGSLDKLQAAGVPERVLARIAASMCRGLRFLKDELNIIHRDVKPTNVLVNRKGQVKLCDFGVSGELNKSMAKTNIGCQSYMAPERIKGESRGTLAAYTVSSDVWSLGLTIIEIALGRYPYPPETYENVFAQLQAIVNGDPPELPGVVEGEDVGDVTGETNGILDGVVGEKQYTYSETARDWVAWCVRKDPERRGKYSELLEHPFLKDDRDSGVDMAGWVVKAIECKNRNALIAARAVLPQSV